MNQLQDLIGRTPLIEFKKMNPNPRVKIFGKLEGHNPGGSVKDRAAYFMIKNALETGKVPTGGQLIEATSGNTGIALAMMARILGVNIELVMPEGSTIERIKTMRAFGAIVTLTPADLGMEGAIDYATKKSRSNGVFMLDQFSNPYNPQAHYETTGPEIWSDTMGQVTHFVAAMGTTGTIMGVSRFLNEMDPTIKIIGAQPSEGSKIPGIRKWPEEYLPKIYNPTQVDRIIEVSSEEASHVARRLALEEAVFSGMSSGGSVFAALQIAREIEQGIIVCIICDRGDRYLSTELFE